MIKYKNIPVIQYFFLFFILFGCFSVQSQTPASEIPSDVILRDDPIAAALDSLHSLNLFESGYGRTVHNNKYNFPKDSVPVYDDATYAARLEALNAKSPFDFQYNSAVKSYINVYAVRSRESVQRIMALSELYFPYFEQQLDKYNLPLELKYLAICESALNPLAHSRAGAMGLWQFMYPTGKMYGLKVTSYVDERCDPYKSTDAACQYFQYLYNLFGDWQMVLAAYNAGPGTINKAIRRSGGGKKTYWQIRPFLPRETQSYVPAFIAVNYVMNHTAEHNLFPAVAKKTFLEIDTVNVKSFISLSNLSKVLNITEDELNFLNPTYRKGIIPAGPNDFFSLTLPANKIGAFIMNEEKIYVANGYSPVSGQMAFIEKEEKKLHTVRKGEKLDNIAKKYNCTVSDIKRWNGIRSNNVKPGKMLSIYVITQSPSLAGATTAQNTIANTEQNNGQVEKEKQEKQEEQEKEEAKKRNKEQFKYYTVQKGDSLYKIAQREKTTIEDIKRLNNFSTHYVLKPGKRIKVGVF